MVGGMKAEIYMEERNEEREEDEHLIRCPLKPAGRGYAFFY